MGLKDYWRILLRHRVYVIATFIVVFASIALWTFAQTPVYEAQGRLLFKQKQTAISASGAASRSSGQLDSVAFGSPLDTQAEIIRSRSVVETIIKRLGLKDPANPKDLIDPDDFLKLLKVEALRRTDFLTIKYRDSDPRLAAQVVNALAQEYMVRNVLDNRSEAASIRKFVEVQLPAMEKQLRAAEHKLRLFKEKYGSIILREEQATAIRVLADFKSQQAQAQISLEASESHTKALADRVGMSEKDAMIAGALMKTDGIKDLRKDLLDVESRLAVLRSQYQDSYPEVSQMIRKRAALRSVLQGQVNRFFQNGQSQSSLLDSTVAGGAEVVGQQPQDNFPRIDAVRQELIRDFVFAKVEELTARTRLEALNTVTQGYANRVADLPRLEEAQTQLERSVAATQEAYGLLDRKYYETRIIEAQNIGNAELIDQAIAPIEPIWPRKTLSLAIGAVLAFILGAAVAFVREFTNDSIQTVEDAQEVLGLPVLGTIPDFSDQENTIPIALQDPLSPVSEAYRSLRTNIKFLSTEKPIQVIVVCSAVPQEGKSTTSSNLAAVSAQSGVRVLIIDADLRKPRQHRIWNMTNGRGLTSGLVGEGEWQQHVQSTSQDNLSILTSGPLPPNPVALLESKKMAALVEEARQHFDLVVIDAPPLTAATDGLVLSSLCDGLLLIVRPNIANKRVLAKIKQDFKQSRIKVLGQVVNGVIAANEGFSYYLYNNRYTSEESPVNGNGKAPADSKWFKKSAKERS
ncbi:MAG: polysaccharide biosynthesis tyrosine autokinase [Anaerolineae bacterium]|nr:polysaccharide biosynthesis tyrosine autokinase [Gloeobacterales cyanobacterium ES-bin-313]